MRRTANFLYMKLKCLFLHNNGITQNRYLFWNFSGLIRDEKKSCISANEIIQVQPVSLWGNIVGSSRKIIQISPLMIHLYIKNSRLIQTVVCSKILYTLHFQGAYSHLYPPDSQGYYTLCQYELVVSMMRADQMAMAIPMPTVSPANDTHNEALAKVRACATLPSVL